ncbi:hypothetical protein KI427_16615 [Rhodococcus ruber]|uniref:Uncharacterized protein n=1 Tax=Rhodococcus ruber BKS 20-38 TaxID=1278076 RepID=M2YYG0_9NOCA|nr:hypothetical protein [Rhodococcus ruber]AUM17368.1 hypothetical protein CSW53_13095 [Rhodococcus ruber]EME53743.1 hypothetical protein G352_23926 [Rhodococcus ruber BKS 20-38]QRE81842.1 hypothetical protein F1734_17395 [Rhodococcus ruber]UQB71241.1 hypothetical protein KI427_16615 [Rhodococcus ruber]
MFGITAQHLSQPTTILGLLIVLIIIGGLVPRWLYTSVLKIKDDVIRDLRETNREQARHIDRLITGTSTGVRVAESIHETVLEADTTQAGDR